MKFDISKLANIKYEKTMKYKKLVENKLDNPKAITTAEREIETSILRVLHCFLKRKIKLLKAANPKSRKESAKNKTIPPEARV